MVDAILLVLREVLEATFIITILMVMSQKLTIAFNWVVYALVLGGLSSWLLAHYTYAVTVALNGTGQEWMNALLYICVILALILIALVIAPLLFSSPRQIKYLPLANKPSSSAENLLRVSITIAIGLSLAREVSEIWIYLGGFLYQPKLLQSALTGATIGIGIGLSLGVILYYSLAFMSARKFLHLFFAFLILLCGGLSTQVARQLMQMGIIDAGTPLWDTSGVLSEHSWIGELLYALSGYDSSPNAVQAIFYGIAVAPLLFALLWNWYRRKD